MVRAQIVEDMKTAMKARDSVTLDVVRYLLAQIKNVEIDAKHELGDEEVLALIQKEVKKQKDAIEQFKAGGRTDLVEQEEKKVEILMKYLPKQLSREEVEAEVKTVVETLGSKEFSVVMREAMSRLKGKADGKVVSEIVKEIIG